MTSISDNIKITTILPPLPNKNNKVNEPIQQQQSTSSHVVEDMTSSSKKNTVLDDSEFVSKSDLSEAITSHLAPLEKRLIESLSTIFSNGYTPRANASGDSAQPETSQREKTGMRNVAGVTTGLQHQTNSRKRTRSPSPDERENSDSASERNEDTVSIPDRDDIDKDIRKLMAEEPDSDCDNIINSDDDHENFLTTLSKDMITSTEDTSIQAVDDTLASILNNVWSKSLPGERIKEILTKYHRPENCSHFLVKKCNTEIWSEQLSVKQRTKDLQQHKVQLNLIKSGCAVIGITQSIINIKKAKDVSAKDLKKMLNPLLEACTDALTIMGTAYLQVDQTRRDNIVLSLEKDMQPLAKNVPEDSQWLFGDGITKRVTNLKASQGFFKKKLAYSKPFPSKNLKSFSKFPENQNKGYKHRYNNQKYKAKKYYYPKKKTQQ